MFGDTIFCVEYLGQHYHYGSIAAIYEDFTAKDMKVSAQRLYDFGITKDKPYRNKVCVIKRDKIRRKGRRKLHKFEP